MKLTTFLLARNIKDYGKSNSEITFKLKLWHIGQFSNFRLRQFLFEFKTFCMENRLSNIFKIINVVTLTKAFLKSS